MTNVLHHNPRRHRWADVVLGLLLAWLAAGTLAASETALFDVHHRPAADLVPQLRALLSKEGSVSAYGARLIVRAPAERLDEVRWLIRELDKAPRNLIVEVRTGRARAHRQADVGISGYGMQARVHVLEGHTRSHGDGIQRVRTLDGRPALIRIGLSVPVYELGRTRSGSEVSERLSVRYKEVDTGIVVLPRVHGNQVTVEVHQQAGRPLVATGQFETEQAATVVTGRLGEWIPVGGIETQTSNRGRGIGVRASTRASNDISISVRVRSAD